MTKIGNAENYCQCASKYENNSPICQTCCEFIPPKPLLNESGEPVLDPTTGQPMMTPPKCNFTPCSGNSCQQMINWLFDLINLHTDIKSGLLSFPLINDSRTDVLKELTYTRNQINICSSSQSDGDLSTRMFNCQKVLDDIIPRITGKKPFSESTIIIDKEKIYHYCYGTMTGAIFEKNISTNNWFCCEAFHQQEDLQQKYYENMIENPNYSNVPN